MQLILKLSTFRIKHKIFLIWWDYWYYLQHNPEMQRKQHPKLEERRSEDISKLIWNQSIHSLQYVKILFSCLFYHCLFDFQSFLIRSFIIFSVHYFRPIIFFIFVGKETLPNETMVLFVVSTTGQGEVPDQMKVCFFFSNFFFFRLFFFFHSFIPFFVFNRNFGNFYCKRDYQVIH